MKTEDCQIPLLARGIRDVVVLVQTNEKVRLNGQRDIHCRVRRHNKGRSVPVKDGLHVYKPNGFLWNIQEEEEIPLAIVPVHNSTLPVPIYVKDPQIQLYLPTGFTLGSLYNIDHLVNTILKKLSPEEKKYSRNSRLIDPETKQRLTNLVCEFLDVFRE